MNSRILILIKHFFLSSNELELLPQCGLKMYARIACLCFIIARKISQRYIAW